MKVQDHCVLIVLNCVRQMEACKDQSHDIILDIHCVISKVIDPPSNVKTHLLPILQTQ